jgi:uncharacterized protein (DUF1697 family)
MAELKRLFEEELGFTNVKTLLQSGNVVFSAKAKPKGKAIEDAIEKAFGYRSDVHLMAPEALRQIIESNPLTAEAKKDPSHTVAVIVSQAPGVGAAANLVALAVKKEKFMVTPNAVYIFFGDAMADSKLAGAALDRALGVRGTARNWNTLNKVLELAEAIA